tara:strand:- start:93 stop:614 length:522 start_codon:yes stop_codon:yes gene_type:complete
MKNILFKPFLLLLFLISSSVSAHQLKFSTTLIEYDQQSAKIELMFNVFMDDFALGIKNLLSKEIDYISPSKHEKKDLEKYFETYFKISLNGVELDLQYEEVEIYSDYNAFRFKFSCKKIYFYKGDELFIENNVLFNEFEYQQTNMNVLRIPPFFEEKYYQATFKSATHKLIIK